MHFLNSPTCCEFFRINIKNNNAVIEPLCFFDPAECGERKREKREKKEEEVEVEFFFLFFRSVDD